jgi:predicted RNA-binding protein with PUA domain
MPLKRTNMKARGMLSERTRNILNDIAEDIDNRESRKVLRETIQELANTLESKEQLAIIRSNARLIKFFKKAMNKP